MPGPSLGADVQVPDERTCFFWAAFPEAPHPAWPLPRPTRRHSCVGTAHMLRTCLPHLFDRVHYGFLLR